MYRLGYIKGYIYKMRYFSDIQILENRVQIIQSILILKLNMYYTILYNIV